MKPLKVVELFAGVGGFRIGLEKADKKYFRTIWSNQWEPSTKKQYASEVYIEKFNLKKSKNKKNIYFRKKNKIISETHVCKDINSIPAKDIPDHDLLVGGFPCQDYSVANLLKRSKGIQGKKGVLWWEIYRILKTKKPRYFILENVDRLLSSPSNSREPAASPLR